MDGAGLVPKGLDIQPSNLQSRNPRIVPCLRRVGGGHVCFHSVLFTFDRLSFRPRVLNTGDTVRRLVHYKAAVYLWESWSKFLVAGCPSSRQPTGTGEETLESGGPLQRKLNSCLRTHFRLRTHTYSTVLQFLTKCKWPTSTEKGHPRFCSGNYLQKRDNLFTENGHPRFCSGNYLSQ